MSSEADADQVERRKVLPRRRVLKPARIVFNKRSSTIDCTVRNLTDQGALLILPSILGVPEEFDLIIASEPPRACRVVHKHESSLGVEFTG
jgi:hypothetical protein